MRERIIIVVSVVALTALLVLGVQRYLDTGRGSLLALLAERVESGTSGEATAAVRHLGRLEETGLDLLVTAADDERPPVASAGRREIEKLLTHWQQEAATQRTPRYCSRLQCLSAALSMRVGSCDEGTQLWARRLVRSLLDGLDGVPPAESVAVVANCDYILQVTANAQYNQSLAQNALRSQQAPPVAAAPLGITAPRELSAMDEVPLAGESLEMISERTDDELLQPAAPLPVQKPAPLDDRNYSSALLMPPGSETPPQAITPEAAVAATNKDYHSPMPLEDSLLAGESTNASHAKPAPLNDRELLAKWLAADGVGRQLVEIAIRARGLSLLPEPVARLLCSTDPAERSEGIEQLLSAPGVRPKPWLMSYAEDENADVRLAVVSLFATSTDPVLMEKAWQIALHDKDPRIAGLAKLLQARRDGTQRR